MNQRLTLDPSTFERLLAAALVLQHRNEQEACNRRPVPEKTLARPSETGVHPLNAATTNILAPFDGYRFQKAASLDSKLARPRSRRIAQAVTPLSVLLIVVVFSTTQVWHRERLHTVAAASRTNHPSDDTAEQFRATPMDRVSHMQITDPIVLSVVESLSRYEVPALRRQAKYGDDSAAFVMGMLYETGHFVPRSCTQAAAWVAASASMGNAAAQYNLGLRYRDGDGVPANQDEAEKWLRKAAGRRYSNATLALETLPQLTTGSASRN